MSKYASKLTVMFEEPFWIGLYERMDDGKYSVSKITFGAEPKDYEVYEYFLKNWNKLRFSPSVKYKNPEKQRINPKRLQKIIKKQTMPEGIGTKAQQALKLQQEQGKTAAKLKFKKRRQDKKEHQFELRRQKQKKKHKGH